MLAAAIASGARTATIALGKAASRESVIDQGGLAVRVVLAAPAAPAALAAQAASADPVDPAALAAQAELADPETVLAELADPETVLAGRGPAIDLEALAIARARAIAPALAALAVPAARAPRI